MRKRRGRGGTNRRKQHKGRNTNNKTTRTHVSEREHTGTKENKNTVTRSITVVSMCSLFVCPSVGSCVVVVWCCVFCVVLLVCF